MVLVQNYIRGQTFVLGLLNVDLRKGSTNIFGWVSCIFGAAVLIINSCNSINGGIQSNDAKELISSLTSSVFCLSASVKLLLLQYKWRHSYQQLFDFVDGWYMLDNTISKTFQIMYEMSMYSCGVICVWYLSVPIFAEERVLSVEPYAPLFWNRDTLAGYIFSYISLVANVIFLLMAIFVGDYAIYMCCIGFRNRIDKVRQDFERIKSDKEKVLLLNTVKDHQEIMR